MFTRREFIVSGLAAGGIFGCRSIVPSGDGTVRFGVISDTHVTGRESIPELAKAFAFLRDRGVDAVIHCGDITDFGYIHQLEAFAEAWRQEMPSDIPLIPVLGNRDMSDTKRMPESERREKHALLIRSSPAEHVRRILGVDIGDGLRVRTVKGVPVICADWKHENDLEAFLMRHPELRDPSRPFVHAQHPHPCGTIRGERNAYPATCILNMFPKAVSVSGHSHLPYTKKQTFCRREFTAAAAGSHYLGGGEQQTGIREVAILSVWNEGMKMERFDLRSGFHDCPARDFTPPPPPDARVEGSFVFVQWNVGHFVLGQDGEAGARGENAIVRAQAFRRQVAALEADFLGLCEYDPKFRLGGGAAADTAFGDWPYRAEGPYARLNGNSILARSHALSGTRTVRFGGPRYCLACETEIGGARTVLAQTHLDLHDDDARKAQIAALVREFGSLPRVILSGDFNVTGPDEFKPFSDAGFRMANCGDFGTFLTHRRRKTYYSPAIDNVLVRGFDILSARTADDSMLLSDHRILACRLRPRPLP